MQMLKQSGKHERELQEMLKKGMRLVAQFVDEAHDPKGHALIGIKRLIEVLEDADGRQAEYVAG